jgi:hypothetical protein
MELPELDAFYLAFALDRSRLRTPQPWSRKLLDRVIMPSSGSRTGAIVMDIRPKLARWWGLDWTEARIRSALVLLQERGAVACGDKGWRVSNWDILAGMVHGCATTGVL